MQTLSISKFRDITDKYKYIIVNIYSIGTSAKFVELKSPHHYRTFYVYVPSRYKMNVSDSMHIHETNYSDIQKQYIDLYTDINNVVFIGPRGILHVPTKTDIRYYKFGYVEVPEEKTEEDIVDEIEDKFKDLKSDITSVDDYEFEVVQVGNDADDDTLIFEDASGNVIEKGSNLEKIIDDEPKKVLIEKGTVTFDIKSQETESEANTPEESDIDEEEYSSNYTPKKLKETSLNIGMMYVCISITDFMKKIKDFEKEVISTYILLDTKEHEMVHTKMKEISEVLEKMKVQSFDELKKMECETTRIDQQITRLSAVLIQCEKFNCATKQDEIQNIINETRTTLDELYLKKLDIRDKTFNILKKYLDIKL
jgi:hypothetical protein